MNRRLIASLLGIVLIAAVAVGLTIGTGNTPSLGLDLQGGASVTLQPEGDYDAVSLDVAVEIIRSRVDAIGVAEPEIIRQGDTVVVNLPGVKDQQRALDIVGRTGDLQLRPVLQSGSVDPTAGADLSTATTLPAASTTVPDSAPEEGGPGESRGPRQVSRITATTIADETSTETTVAIDATSETTVPETTQEATPISAPQTELPPGTEVLLGRDGFAYLVGPVAATGLVF